MLRFSGKTIRLPINSRLTRLARLAAGVILMGVSFLVYPAHLVIFLLPTAVSMKVAVALLASLLSWGVFCGGFFLAGQEGYDWLMRRSRGKVNSQAG